MKISTSDLKMNMNLKTSEKKEYVNIDKKTEASVQNKVEKDLISKMLFIEKALAKEEEKNEEKIKEIKSKIEKNEYSISGEAIIERIERGGF